MRPSDWIQLGSLLVAAIGLPFLVGYVKYTKRIRDEAVKQTEASFKPAIIAISGESMDANSKLKNIGRGPALMLSGESQAPITMDASVVSRLVASP